MSSDLRNLLRSDLERIPLPPEERWTLPRTRRTGLLSAAVVAIVVALVVIGSLGGGEAIRALRDRIESDRTAGGVVVPGEDFVYVSDGTFTSPGGGALAQAVQVVAMPAGQSVRRVVGDTYVGTPYQGGVTSLSGDWAYLPIARNTGGVGSDEHTTYLQEVDLAHGFATGLIRIEVVTAPRALQAELPGTPIFPAATAVSSDGKSLWLVRDTGEQGRTTLVDRFDVQEIRKAIGSGTTEISLAPLAHVVLATSGPGAVRSRVVALGTDRLAIVREHFESLNRGAADWFFLDAQLRVIASYADDSEHRLPTGGECSTDLHANPVRAEWVILCSDSSLSSAGALLFLDSGNFAVTAAVTLPRERGFALGMTSARDGTIYVLTDRPGIARINALTHQTIDARPVTEARSWIDHLLPPVAAAKSPGGPAVVFSPDARYAYLAGSPDAWWGSLATIDLRDAKVVAHTSAFGAVSAVGLSPGGERLYALSVDGDGVRRVILLAPSTLRLAGRSSPLSDDPFAIVAVRRQTPPGP
jgi:hypothetical protein